MWNDLANDMDELDRMLEDLNARVSINPDEPVPGQFIIETEIYKGLPHRRYKAELTEMATGFVTLCMLGLFVTCNALTSRTTLSDTSRCCSRARSAFIIIVCLDTSLAAA